MLKLFDFTYVFKGVFSGYKNFFVVSRGISDILGRKEVYRNVYCLKFHIVYSRRRSKK
jgi:hypothetical protein